MQWVSVKWIHLAWDTISGKSLNAAMKFRIS